MRSIKRIFVHCTAGSQKQTIEDLRKEFKNKGWKNPGYHYVVMPDGTIKTDARRGEGEQWCSGLQLHIC